MHTLAAGASGMSAALAQGVAVLGPVNVVALPFIAALGGYLTGSNSAANAMLAAPQAQIATTLELSQLPAMAVHNVASSLLLMGTPAKVELAAQLRPNAKIGCLAEPRVLLVDLTMVVCLAALLVLATVR